MSTCDEMDCNFRKIDNISNSKILDDYLSFIESEYKEITNRLSDLSEKYTFVLTVISILLGSNIVLSTQLLTREKVLANSVNTFFGIIYILASFVLLLIFCIFLHRYRQRIDYLVVDEFELTSTAEYYSNITDYKKARAKSLIYIIHTNHHIFEKRKNGVKQLILPLEICAFAIVICAPIIIFNIAEEKSIKIIISVVKSYIL